LSGNIPVTVLGLIPRTDFLIYGSRLNPTKRRQICREATRRLIPESVPHILILRILNQKAGLSGKGENQ